MALNHELRRAARHEAALVIGLRLRDAVAILVNGARMLRALADAQRAIVTQQPRTELLSLVDLVAACPELANMLGHAPLALGDTELPRLLRWMDVLCRAVADTAPDLFELDATNADLSDAKFSRLCISRSRLSAQLVRAQFDRAVLTECELVAARLQNTCWKRARVANSNLFGANLAAARFQDVVFEDCDLRGADFSDVSRAGVPQAQVGFRNCDLRGSIWDGRVLDAASFLNCKLYGARGELAHGTPTITNADVSPIGDGSRLVANLAAFPNTRVN